MKGKVIGFRIAMRPGERRALPDTPEGRLVDLIETAKAHIRAMVEHPFRVIKQQFGFQKTRLRGMLLPRTQAERGGATRNAAKSTCWQPSRASSWLEIYCYVRREYGRRCLLYTSDAADE